MKSVIDEIALLRHGKRLHPDTSNSNPYQIVAMEDSGLKTAYCFSVPIYNQVTRKLVDLTFQKAENGLIASGSSAKIRADDVIQLSNDEGSCCLETPDKQTATQDNTIHYGRTKVTPTLNGVFLRIPCLFCEQAWLRMQYNGNTNAVRTNLQSFSLMSEKFRPFITVSCIGAADEAGKIIAPCFVESEKKNDQEYLLLFKQNSIEAKYVHIEINLYAKKLFQDTTVESLHPKKNNAFGGTAFIGRTELFGEQWLYSRPDFSVLPDLYDKRIRKAVLHLPAYCKKADIKAHMLETRFCSFGSNWNNKRTSSSKAILLRKGAYYYHLDLTQVVTNEVGFIRYTEGFILKKDNKESAFSAISTGDSFFAPQILEIVYE